MIGCYVVQKARGCLCKVCVSPLKRLTAILEIECMLFISGVLVLDQCSVVQELASMKLFSFGLLQQNFHSNRDIDGYGIVVSVVFPWVMMTTTVDDGWQTITWWCWRLFWYIDDPDDPDAWSFSSRCSSHICIFLLATRFWKRGRKCQMDPTWLTDRRSLPCTWRVCSVSTWATDECYHQARTTSLAFRIWIDLGLWYKL